MGRGKSAGFTEAPFRELYTRFYLHNDPAAGHAVHALESARLVDGAYRLLGGDVDVSGLTVLRGCGIDEHTKIDTEMYWRLMKARDECRKAAHEERAIIKKRRVSEKVLDVLRGSVRERTKKRGGRVLRAYWEKYKGMLGAEPVLLGMKLLLQAQRNEAKILDWILPDVELCSGGDHFVDDTVAILGSCLGLEPRILDEELCRNEHIWSVSSVMKDSEISSFLSAMAKLDHEDDILAAGHFVVTDKLRSKGVFEKKSNTAVYEAMALAVVLFGLASILYRIRR